MTSITTLRTKWQNYNILRQKCYFRVRKKIRKRCLFKKVQAFCEEKVLRYLLGVFLYAKSKNHVGKLKNGVYTILLAYFQDGRQIEESVE